jgi:hypothetical protein
MHHQSTAQNAISFQLIFCIDEVPRAGDFSPSRNGPAARRAARKPVIAASDLDVMRILDQLAAWCCPSNL